MSDLGHEQTDKELKRIENLISKEYSQAAHELEEKMKKHYADFDRKDAEMKKQKDSGKITDTQYNNWRVGQIAIGERWKSVRDSMVDTLVNTDKTAMKIIQGNSIKAYGDNMNYGTYEVEHGTKINTGFTLYDENTVKNLLKEDPKIIPLPKDDIPKDERWNRQKLTSAVTQGILQGESIPGIAKRLSEVAMMDKNSAIRNARTYTTAAENKGRIDSYERAESLGIKTNKKWIATLDDRTRAEHRHLDNMSVPYDEDFEVDGYKIGFPGDPSAEPEMFYNCRCTLVADIIGYEQIAGTEYQDVRNDEKLGDMTYEEWKHAKDKESKEEKQENEEIKVLRHYTSKENVDNILENGFDLSKSGTSAGDVWGKGAYFLEEGTNEELFYKFRLSTEDYVEAKIDVSNMLTVNTLSPKGDAYSNTKTMYGDASKSFTEEEQKEYKALLKEMDPKDAFYSVAESHYFGLVVEQELSSGALDPLVGGNQVVVFDEKAIVSMTKESQEEESKETREVVQGTDISSSWERRTDKFDFEIEDIVNAQGFDGLPRVVSADEFDKAVADSNFIAQRTYSAPDKETLNEYQNMLYNGKWYIDCSVGGAQYGQGMYCAADYNGNLEGGIKVEMETYRNGTIGRFYREMPDEDRQKIIELRNKMMEIDDELYGDPPKVFMANYPDLVEQETGITIPRNQIETLTLDPSARIITLEDITSQREKDSEKYKDMDIGAYAALKGYDAINAEGHGESGSYTVILNRTKLIIKGE